MLQMADSEQLEEYIMCKLKTKIQSLASGDKYGYTIDW